MKVRWVLFQLLVMIVGMLKGVISLKLMVGLGHEYYAVLSQYLVLAMASTQLILLNYDAPFISRISKGEKASIAYSALLHLLLFNFILIFLMAFFFDSSISSFIWGSVSYKSYVPFLMVYILLLSLNLLTLLCFQSQRKFDYYGTFQIFQQLLQLLATLIGVYFNDVFLLLTLLIFVELLLWIGSGFLCARPDFLYKNVVVSFNWLKSGIQIAFPLLVSFFMIWILNNGGRLLLVEQKGLISLAPYAATYSIAILSGLLINPICSVFFPYFSSTQNDHNAGTFGAVVSAQLVLLVFGGGVSLFIIIFSGFLLSILASPTLFAGSFFVFFICVAQLFYGQSRILSLYLAVNDKARSSLYAFTLGATILIIVGWFVVKTWQEQGAAFALMLGSLGAMAWLLATSPTLVAASGLIRGRFTIQLCWFGTLLFMLFAAYCQFDEIGEMIFAFVGLIIAYAGFLWLILRAEPIMCLAKVKLNFLKGGLSV
ncbi:hypothetical protein [Aeromonas veronii]|uniref:hypothetical protein n=1 Tax=Aeromonas veronii TaxID=654 RepID=UPI003D1F496F